MTSTCSVDWIGKSVGRWCVDCGVSDDNLLVRSIVGNHYVLECVCGTLYWNLTKSRSMSLQEFEGAVNERL